MYLGNGFQIDLDPVFAIFVGVLFIISSSTHVLFIIYSDVTCCLDVRMKVVH